MAGTTQSQDEGITGINVTPLVDVMLVLLIIFMVTANLVQNKAIGVTLPPASTGDTEPPKTSLRLEISKDGAVKLNEQATELGDLGKAVAALRQGNAQVTASIAADRLASHGRVIDVIDAIREQGIQDFAFTVAPE